MILCAPVACFTPVLLSVLTHLSRASPVLTWPVVPAMSPTMTSAVALCCESRQLLITVSSVSPAYEDVRPPCTASAPQSVVIFAAALMAALVILSVSLILGQAPGTCLLAHLAIALIFALANPSAAFPMVC